MFVVLQILFNLVNHRRFKKAKPFTLHCSLLGLVLLYAFVGGLVFNKLENDALKQQREAQLKERTHCVLAALHGGRRASNLTAESIAQCWAVEKDERSEWGYVTATLYGFGIVTTLGYNRIGPITTEGRLFCIFYGIIGIPITMIIIANVGQYLNQFASHCRKQSEDDVDDASIEYASLALLIVFSAYVAFGAWLLPLLNGQIDFVNGLYYNFLCLTAIDFGQLVPQRVAFLPITFAYVCIGLAITTIAIEVGSEYMKKLHYIGQRMKSVATTKIWFGGKTLKVRDLLHAVGRKCGVDPYVIDRMDLDNVVERVIAIHEGREPPHDMNEEPPPPKEPQPTASPIPKQNGVQDSPRPPSEACPLLHQSRAPSMKSRHTSSNSHDIVIRNPTFETLSSHQSPGLEVCNLDMVLDECELVAIDMPDTFEEEEAFGWEAPVIVSKGSESVVPRRGDMVASLQPVAPVVVLDDAQQVIKMIMEEEQKAASQKRERSGSRTPRSPSPSDDELVPKKFREKKEKYGRDAQKLFETYQEEWERLQKLSSKRLGPRRKSVLTLNTVTNANNSPKD
uniref:Ion_trans_2 domain-containing protein n=1 Tax=Steinernema glaseri TaxID=37863 RepID=A0A1I7YNG5_9BILA